MDERAHKVVLLALAVLLCLWVAYLAATRPGLFSNQTYLAGLVFLQLLLAAVWKFRERFFPLLIFTFVWAGVALPLREAWGSGRWAVLAVGAAVGVAIFVRDRLHLFGVLQLVALVCVGAAFVSAMVSVYPGVSVLKALSLGLLFLYASSGGRVAIVGREAGFLAGLLLGCEITVYLTALSYLVVHLELWGNPNSLGLVMGMVSVPLLLWGVLVAETRSLRGRRALALTLATALLFLSRSRASILAAVVGGALLCIALRRGRLLLKGAGIALCLLATLGIISPRTLRELTDFSTSEVVYKGDREAGILGSRRTPWQETTDVIRAHPWFGSGFGTSPTGKHRNAEAKYASNTDTNREHGNSYLALLEWVGVLGLSPFLVLLLLIVWKIGTVLAWMRRTANPYHAAVPVVAVLCAGMVHAGFEDWLFAVGNYTCVFFWTLAFALPDVAPAKTSAVASDAFAWPRTPHTSRGFAAVAPGR